MLQGRCTLRPDAGGRVLDRLAGLEQVIPPQAIQQALAASGRRPGRACVLTPEVMLWVVLAMGLWTDLPLRQVFKQARRLRPGEATPGRSALCQGRRRLGVAPVRHLFGQVVRPLATPRTPGAFYRGRRLVGVDGTLLDVPDTPANARAFGRPTGGRGDGAFPQVRKVSLVELGTHAEIACAFKRRRRGESTLAAGLVRHVPADALLLADRHFYSFPLWNRLHTRGIPCLWRVSATPVLRPRRALADGSYLARVYRRAYDRDRDRNGLDVRVIRYTLDDPQRVGHGEPHILVTSLLDAAAAPALELVALYHERWEQELVYDEQKTHLDPRRAHKPAALRSETPAGVLQELYALSLAHYVVRALMAAAAAPAGLDPDRLSFTGCVQVLRCRLPECPSRTRAAREGWFDALLAEMRREQNGPRRNRINPRVVKQKVKHWPKKRPEHRGVPPLRKRFIESVVLIT
jgi:hypothetical protein